MPDNGGAPVLSTPQLVAITFDGDGDGQQMEDYVGWLAGSSWLTQVGADYGVGAGQAYASIRITDAAPQQIDDTQIQTWLEQLMAKGTVPPPGGALTQPLYVIFYPSSTTVTVQGEASCQDFAGYHSEVRDGTRAFPYAVVANCPELAGSSTSALEELESTASHEIIEASTDPYPLDAPTWILLDPSSPWSYLPGEVGDLCVGADAQVDGHWVQRIWSNSAAAAGAAPCIPAPAGPYFSTSVADSILSLAPGRSATVMLAGWSSASVAPWSVDVYVAGTFIPQASWGTAGMQNGQQLPLEITVPDAVQQGAGEYAILFLVSHRSPSDFNFWPVVVQVP